MGSIVKLKQQRAKVKAQVTRTENAFNTPQQMTAQEAEIRLNKLEDYWKEFDRIQQEIEDKDPTEGEDTEAIVKENETERQLFEQRYYALAAKAKAMIDADKELVENRRRQYNAGQNQQGNPENVVRVETHVRHNKPKLPEIKLLEFDGDWTKWVFFRNSFETTIYNDPDLNEMQKHQYLLGILRGEALKVIEGFEINDRNCTVVWQLLKDTYNNEMMIIESHLDQLFNFPSILKDNKAQSIKNLIWHIQTHMQSLKALKQPTDHWDTMIIHLAKKKLDYTEHKEWQDKIKDKTPTNMPTLAEFIKFSTERCHTLRMLNQINERPSATHTSAAKQLGNRERKNEKKVMLAATTSACKSCKGDHPIFKCEEFLKLSSMERKNCVLDKKLCFNCCKTGHLGRECYASTCRKCDDKHNTLLHSDESEKLEKTQERQRVNCCTERDEREPAVIMYCVRKPSSPVILSTAQIHINDVNGRKIICRALLDPGSQINLITQELMKRLKIPCIRNERTFSGVNQTQASTSKVITVQMSSTNGDFSTEIECLVLSSITEAIPQTQLDTDKINIPQGIQLADPTYHEPGKIDILIGAGLYWRLIQGSPVNQSENQPAWQKTKLGWIVGGEILNASSSQESACFKITNADLNKQLERFWVQECIPEVMHYSKDEQSCEKHFVETMERDTNGRFIVKLPLRSEITLGESRPQAMKRVQAIERRFQRHSELAEAYIQFMDDYLTQGHMSLTDETSLKPGSFYFIPHQPVIRPDSVTTKMRVVFDASAKTSQGTSLNDKLLPGPNLQGNLFNILLRFRMHEVVLTGDITQMYRQIWVHSEDRPYQLILWRPNPQEEARSYALNTVTYGTASAPFHALRCLKELAQEHLEEYSLAAETINNDFYMDDCLSGGETLYEVALLQEQLAQLLLKGQFVMRKWRSNKPELLTKIKNTKLDNALLVLDGEEAMKTLGLLWNSRKDTLQYQVRLSDMIVNTKRSVLSTVSQIFDPLGLVAPVLINGKLFMQELWFLEVDWDDPLPEEHLDNWRTYYLSLSQLTELMIKRNVKLENNTNKIDIYGFGDASQRAFGACVYAVSQNSCGETVANLLCAKSKVAPLRTISLPRLELEAALLLANLIKTVKSALDERIRDIYLWSDSTIVLSWIKMESRLLKTFVANRVAKIQASTEGLTWNHVLTHENPADLVSRGTSVENLLDNKLWWHGPSWITDASRRPAPTREVVTDLPEMRTTQVVLAMTWTSSVLLRFSSFRKLCRVIALCYRFISNCGKNKKICKLDWKELEKAETTVLQWLQKETFAAELLCIGKETDVPKKSPLRALKVYMGQDGLLRVGGRLMNAQIPEEVKHPIVLPPKHHITRLIMRGEHQRLKHCPPEQLLCSLRQRFWPICGRLEAQATVKRCIPCFRFKLQVPEVLMGSLPEERVRASARPFSVTGVDYAGPFQIRESRRRGRIHISQAYVAVFVCFSTKAVHLELVSELTTEAFLAALSRFTARRGLCLKIFSDNGTNFVGAARELEEIHEFLKKEQMNIAKALEEQHIEWHFSPPRAPHFGGLWEATVKIMKRHLLTVTQGKIFTFEEGSTLLTEIEAILNTRPLTPLSNDPSDFTALTPSHFLIGGSLLQPLQPNLLQVPDSHLSRWQSIQKLRQQLWQRWQREYLQELQKRKKWCEAGVDIQPGTLVLIMDDSTSPLHWPMGRVVTLHPGKDGVTRVVVVQTQTGTLKRPVKKLCPLPLDQEEI